MMTSRPTPPLWQTLTRSELDAAYDNTHAVADSSEQLAGFEERSAGLSLRYPDHLDLRYGPRERQRIDYFSTGKSHSPVLLFIHGGYWQMRRKETFRFLASGPLRHGIDVALAGYTLEHQSAEGLLNADGYATDAVASVSIYAGGYLNAVKECLLRAVPSAG